MSLQAFTNQEGGHLRYDYARNVFQSQSYFDNGYPIGNGSPSYTFVPFTAESCFKSPLIRSDRVLPTTFRRNIRKVESHKPLITQQLLRYSNGQISNLARMENTLIDKFDPMSFGEIPGTDVRMSDALDAAITRARNKLRDGKLQNGVDIIEARKTASMVGDDFLTLLKLFKGHRDIATLRDLTGGSLANWWLKWIYGYKPTLQSVTDNIHQLDKMLNKPKTIHFNVTGGRDITLSLDEVVNGYHFRSSFNGGVRCKLMANLSNEFLASLDTNGLLNPAEVLWELFPYSFVVDWFTGVGDYLQSLSATAGLVLIAGYTSSRSEGTYHVASRRDDTDSTFKTISQGEITAKSFGFSRVNTPLWPLGGLTPKDNPFSTSHVIAALALFRQLFR